MVKILTRKTLLVSKIFAKKYIVILQNISIVENIYDVNFRQSKNSRH